MKKIGCCTKFQMKIIPILYMLFQEVWCNRYHFGLFYKFSKNKNAAFIIFDRKAWPLHFLVKKII